MFLEKFVVALREYLWKVEPNIFLAMSSATKKIDNLLVRGRHFFLESCGTRKLFNKLHEKLPCV